MARRAPQVELAAALAALAGCSFDSPAALDGMPATPAEAGAADAGPFDPAADCPGSYTVSLPSTASTSRYRVEPAPAQFWPHSAACHGDRRGRTHAASLGTMQEVLELNARLVAIGTATTRYYLGAVQDPQAAGKDLGWIWFDGTPLLKTAWYTGEPNDGTASPFEGRVQQLLIIDRTLPYLQDAVGTSAYGIVCECDGTPVAAMAQDFVDRDPNNPNL